MRKKRARKHVRACFWGREARERRDYALTTRCRHVVNARDTHGFTRLWFPKIDSLKPEQAVISSQFCQRALKRSWVYVLFGGAIYKPQCECSGDFDAQQHSSGTSRGIDQAWSFCRSFERELSTIYEIWARKKRPKLENLVVNESHSVESWLGQTDRQVVARGRKLNFWRDLRWVTKWTHKFPRKYTLIMG